MEPAGVLISSLGFYVFYGFLGFHLSFENN